MRACINKRQRQNRFLLQIDQKPVRLYAVFPEQLHAARKLVVVKFLFERDAVFQLVDDIFKQGNFAIV